MVGISGHFSDNEDENDNEDEIDNEDGEESIGMALSQFGLCLLIFVKTLGILIFSQSFLLPSICMPKPTM